MRYDCVIVRVGELALKGKFVHRRFFSILLRNIKAALEGLKYSILTEHNRIYVYGETKKILEKLRKVFGIISLSPAMITEPKLEEMSHKGGKIAGKFLHPGKSFAIRASREGFHPFSSKEIAETAGNFVREKTGAKVNLTRPDFQIFIECREKKAYIYLEKLAGAGGLPLGSGGSAIAFLENKEDILAAWMIARKGVTLKVFDGKKTLLKRIRNWHIGKNLTEISKRELENAKEFAVVCGEKSYKKNKAYFNKNKKLILGPLTGLGKREISKLAARI